ncbi:hypothetical protein C8Q74DRAFT_1212896 [Fomes fomentarius]|nr:hypothetical protein C8Q74DRAFT_1212896 [Fomes fomentarius]
MAHPPPAPIYVDPEALFAPRDGLTYSHLGERRRIFAQQPLPGPIVPVSYLIPSRTAQLKPPTIRLGWRLGPYKLMELACRYFPDTIERCDGPPTAGMFDSNGEELTFPDEAWEEEIDNILETILGVSFAIALRSLLGIPESREYEKMARVFLLYDSEFKAEYTLTIGTNYFGIPSPEAVAKLQEMVASVAPDVHLMWYLDPFEWQWHRVPTKPKQPKGTRTKKVVRKKVAKSAPSSAA